ncbi:hypothetical protein UMZ34_17685 [Halopseudomonas pachastrellae]|nr:hypothetical protein UMZ34_17685 [Halopseudomonas pachastrellae]
MQTADQADLPFPRPKQLGVLLVPIGQTHSQMLPTCFAKWLRNSNPLASRRQHDQVLSRQQLLKLFGSQIQFQRQFGQRHHALLQRGVQYLTRRAGVRPGSQQRQPLRLAATTTDALRVQHPAATQRGVGRRVADDKAISPHRRYRLLQHQLRQTGRVIQQHHPDRMNRRAQMQLQHAAVPMAVG